MDAPGNTRPNSNLACVSANENDGDEFTSITAHRTLRQDLVISAVKKSIPTVSSRKHRAIASAISRLSA